MPGIEEEGEDSTIRMTEHFSEAFAHVRTSENPYHLNSNTVKVKERPFRGFIGLAYEYLYFFIYIPIQHPVGFYLNPCKDLDKVKVRDV